MALKAVLEKLEEVAEALRPLYTEKDGKFVLDVEGLEDTNGLKSALEKERKAARDYEKQNRAWRDLGKTPEEIQALVEAQRKAEEEKATKAGEWDKLKGQIVEKHMKELKSKDDAIASMKQTLEKHLVDAAATEAIAAAKGVPPLLLPHVRAYAKVVEDNGEYVVRIVDAKGDPRVNQKGDFLSIKDLVEEMRQSEVFGRAFDASGRTGSGAPLNQRPGGSAPITLSREDAKDPAKYRAAKEAAAKAGVEIQIAPQ